MRNHADQAKTNILESFSPLSERKMIDAIAVFYGLDTNSVSAQLKPHLDGLNLDKSSRFFLRKNAAGGVDVSLIDPNIRKLHPLGTFSVDEAGGRPNYKRTVALEAVNNAPGREFQAHLAESLEKHISPGYVYTLWFDYNQEVLEAKIQKSINGWYIAVRKSEDAKPFLHLYFDEAGNLRDNSLVNGIPLANAQAEMPMCYNVAGSALEQAAKNDEAASIVNRLRRAVKRVQEVASGAVEKTHQLGDGIKNTKDAIQKALAAAKKKVQIGRVAQPKQDPATPGQGNKVTNLKEFQAKRKARDLPVDGEPQDPDTPDDIA